MMLKTLIRKYFPANTFRGKVITFLWKYFYHLKSFAKVIYQTELKLANFFTNKGFRVGALCDIVSLKSKVQKNEYEYQNTLHRIFTNKNFDKLKDSDAFRQPLSVFKEKGVFSSKNKDIKTKILANTASEKNPHLYFWDMLIRDMGFPFLKVRLLRDEHWEPLVSRKNWYNLVKETEYDVNLIRRHLARVLITN